MLKIPRPNSGFHANPMIWSTRSLGHVALNHSRTNITTNIFNTNHACPGTGSKPFVPPRNNVVTTAAVIIGAINSAKNRIANLIPLNSVL